MSNVSMVEEFSDRCKYCKIGKRNITKYMDRQIRVVPCEFEGGSGPRVGKC